MAHVFLSVDEALTAYLDWPWEFFHPERDKMACSKTGTLIIEPAFMDRMDNLRRRYGKPIRVNSWYRSPEYNDEISDTGLDGPHTTGRAVDIDASGEDAILLTVYGYEIGFTGFGWKQKGKSRFVHLDDLLGTALRPRPWPWSY